MSGLFGQTASVALGLLAAPLLGGLVIGADRVLTARLQGRVGPPLAQPFFDAAKLLGKAQLATNPWQGASALLALFSALLAVGLFAARADLLAIFFVQTATSVFLILGALSVNSPYGQIGAQRELMQMLAYEPLFLLVIVGAYLKTGSFGVQALMAAPRPLLWDAPLLFIAFGFVLAIKCRKSPFDIASSRHAHQEIVRGVYTDYSGPHLGLLEIAHWCECALLLGICALFWATNLWIGAALALVTYLAEIVVDNVSARLTWRFLLGSAWGVGLTLAILNLLWLRAG